MIYENTLVMYNAGEYLDEEAKDKEAFLVTIEKLKSLREFDPEAYDELVQAMILIRDGNVEDLFPVSYNKLAEYGLMDNEAVKEIMDRQERILAIVRSNKSIKTLSDAIFHLGDN